MAKRIAAQLRVKLLTPHPPARITVDDYTFSVLADQYGPLESALGIRAQFLAPSSVAGPVSARRLCERADTKVRKYAQIADACDVPLVVAIGAHRFTGVDLSNLDDLLLGRATIQFQFNIGDAFIGSQDISLEHPARWAMRPELSGILWLSNQPPFGATARPNGDAKRPMPAALAALRGSVD
jgi:hypothetical protein